MPRRSSGRLARALAFALSFLLPGPLLAGLHFQRAPAPEGADVAALAGDATRLWAATIRGVWKYEAGQWTFDGLGDKTLTSVAVQSSTAFVADGSNVYRREVDGSWVVESLPSPTAFPVLLARSGSVLFAAGVGVYVRDGVWYALPPPPGGFAQSLAVTESGDVVVGFADGVAARYSGSGWSTISGGVGPGETIQALASYGGTLYAGTQKGLYGQFGSQWNKVVGFGTHDVRALTAAQGALRAATADAGVLLRGASGWTNESTSFATFFTKSFGTSGADLFVGTGGGPVYRLLGASWTPVISGLDAAVVSDVSWGIVATRGAGASALDAPGTPLALPPGCADLAAVGAVAAFGPNDPGSQPLLVSNACGALVQPFTTPLTSGLPPGAVFTSVSDYGGLAGTANAGVQLFTGASWVPLNAGISDTASVQAVRSFERPQTLDTYAAVQSGVFRLGAQNVWTDVSPGLPGGVVLSLGGSDRTLYAGLSGGGVHRRDDAGLFVEDAAGLSTASVFSVEATAQGPVAATGTGGVRLKRGGGWIPETLGLPTGVDARVVRASDATLYAGTAGSGLFSASIVSAVRTIPVVLDVVGNAAAHFRTELTLGNRGATSATVHLTFSPAPGFGAPQLAPATITTTLAAGAELHAADALDFLRSNGVAIPAATGASPIAGSLSITADASATDSVYGIARTYTSEASGGTFGLFYDAPSDLEAAEDQGFVYGLRSFADKSRSNLAMVHLPGRSSNPITLSVQVFTAAGAPAHTPIDVSLQPGEWRQLNGILEIAGLPEGSFGYARITRTSGIGPWTAYGVVNDAKTSDGSFLPLFRPGGVTAARRLLVPVVLDVYGEKGSHFTTELTLVNDGPIATPVDLFYQPAPGGGSAPGVPYVTVNLAARQQLTIPDAIQYLREHGIHVPAATTGAQVGTLEASFRYLGSLDAPRTVALARTSTPNPDASAGGAFGLFYPAIALGQGARTSAIVPALTENASVRSNLALVHAGGGSGLPMTLKVELHDAATGAAVGRALTATLAPGDWVQYSKVLSVAGAAPATTRAYAVVTRVSGDDTFYAYGVLNDNVTSDGSFLSMIPADRD